MRWAEPHLRCVDLDAQMHLLGSRVEVLSPGERVRAGRYCFAGDRQRFVARRVLLRELLAERIGCTPAELVILEGPSGKPELHSGAAALSRVTFNCAHSGGTALFAFALGERIGVDVERIRPIRHLDQVARSHFTRSEYGALEQCEPLRRSELFLRYWTLKEAYLKATGEGLSRAPETVELRLGPDGLPRLLAIDGCDATARWLSLSLSPRAGYVGALVLERRSNTTRSLPSPGQS